MKIVRITFLAIAILVGLTAPLLAQATNRGVWVQVKYGQTDAGSIKLDNTLDNVGDTFDAVFSGDENVQSFGLGFRLNNWIGFQAEYTDFDEFFGSLEACSGGVVCPPVETPIQAKTKAYSLSVVPQIPLTGSLTLFLKVGAVSWSSDVSAGPLDLLSSDYDGEELIYGGGLRLRLIAGLAIFYEYEVIDGLDIKSQYIGLGWFF